MNFDIAIIGGGPAGYTAAERAGANGLKPFFLRKRQWVECVLNEGCIPTKTLLYSAKILDSIKVLPNMAFLPNLLRSIYPRL